MFEQDFRKTLTREELEQRAFIVPFKVYDFAVLERLNTCSMEFEKTWDDLMSMTLSQAVE